MCIIQGEILPEHPIMLTSIICSSFITCIGPKSFSVLLRAVWWRITHNALQQSSSWSTHLSEISPTRGKCAFSSKTTSTAPRRRGERRVRNFAVLSQSCKNKLPSIRLDIKEAVGAWEFNYQVDIFIYFIYTLLRDSGLFFHVGQLPLTLLLIQKVQI